MKALMKLVLIPVVLMLNFVGVAVAAEVPTYNDPSKMMEEVADKTFRRIAADQPKIQQNLEHLRVVVNEELVPYIDTKYAAFRVIGNYIQQTTEQERDEFVKAFTDYMVGTYAGAFTSYKNQKVIIEPVKVTNGQKIISVKTRVVDPGKPDINIEFKLRRVKDGENWLVFDMVAEGISLLDSKRAELGSMIRQQGLAKVTTLLVEKAKAPVAPLVKEKNA